MECIATWLTVIIKGVQTAIGGHLSRDLSRLDLLERTWYRIHRMGNRLQSLFTRWQAGKLRRHPTRARATPRAAREPRITPYFPRHFAWLCGIVGYHAAGRGCQLEALMTRPDMQAFIAEVPQAGRILRPLCKMLGVPGPPRPEPIPHNTPAPAQAASPVATTPRPESAPEHPAVIPPPPWQFSPA